MGLTAERMLRIMRERNISLPEGTGVYGKVTNDDLERAIAAHSLQTRTEPVAWGMTQRLSIGHVALAYSYKHLSDEEKRDIMDSPEWVAEIKENGVRGLLTYHPGEGLGFYGRNKSRQTLLPMDYTEKVLIRDENGLRNMSEFAGKFGSLRFVLDGEICALPGGYVESSNGSFTDSLLDAVVAVLGMNAHDSMRAQRTTCPLVFIAWDVLLYDDFDAISWPARYSKRREVLDELFGTPLGSKHLNIQKNKQYTNKRKLFSEALDKGEEGILLKNIHAPYTTTKKRHKEYYVKLKRSMQVAGETDIDAFVSGYTLGEQYTKLGLIAGIKLSVLLQDESGDSKEHWIATVSGMDMSIRTQLSALGADGLPRLKDEYYGKVLTVDGQDISARNMRLSHAVADWKRGFREDKDAEDCTMESSFIESQIF